MAGGASEAMGLGGGDDGGMSLQRQGKMATHENVAVSILWRKREGQADGGMGGSVRWSRWPPNQKKIPAQGPS